MDLIIISFAEYGSTNKAGCVAACSRVRVEGREVTMVVVQEFCLVG